MPSSPFSKTFSFAVSTASGSLSTAVISRNPRRAAPIASIPEPVPTSSSDAFGRTPGKSQLSSHSRQSRVVSWCPVPKARPGSIRMMSRSGSRGSGSQVGETRNRLPTGSGLKFSFHFLDQSSSGISETEISLGSSPGSRATPSTICAQALPVRGKPLRIQVEREGRPKCIPRSPRRPRQAPRPGHQPSPPRRLYLCASSFRS